VSRVVEQRLAGDGFVRLPKSLCFSQDLYIVRSSGHLDRDRRFWRGPYGQVAEVDLVEVQKRRYGLGHRHGRGPEPRGARQGGKEEACPGAIDARSPRLDQEVPGPEGLHPKGWTASFRLSARAVRPSAALTVAARSPGSGQEFVLDLVPLSDRLATRRRPSRVDRSTW
jgi:hypothetical protein